MSYNYRLNLIIQIYLNSINSIKSKFKFNIRRFKVSIVASILIFYLVSLNISNTNKLYSSYGEAINEEDIIVINKSKIVKKSILKNLTDEFNTNNIFYKNLIKSYSLYKTYNKDNSSVNFKDINSEKVNLFNKENINSTTKINELYLNYVINNVNYDIQNNSDTYKLNNNLNSNFINNILNYNKYFKVENKREAIIKNYFFLNNREQDYFNFHITDEELLELTEKKIVFFEDRKWKDHSYKESNNNKNDNVLNKGNILSFYRHALEHNKPVFFSADSILDGFGNSINFLIFKSYELFFNKEIINLLYKIIIYLQVEIENNNSVWNRSKLEQFLTYFLVPLNIIDNNSFNLITEKLFPNLVKNNNNIIDENIINNTINDKINSFESDNCLNDKFEYILNQSKTDYNNNNDKYKTKVNDDVKNLSNLFNINKIIYQKNQEIFENLETIYNDFLTKKIDVSNNFIYSDNKNSENKKTSKLEFNNEYAKTNCNSNYFKEFKYINKKDKEEIKNKLNKFNNLINNILDSDIKDANIKDIRENDYDKNSLLYYNINSKNTNKKDLNKLNNNYVINNENEDIYNNNNNSNNDNSVDYNNVNKNINEINKNYYCNEEGSNNNNSKAKDKKYSISDNVLIDSNIIKEKLLNGHLLIENNNNNNNKKYIINLFGSEYSIEKLIKNKEFEAKGLFKTTIQTINLYYAIKYFEYIDFNFDTQIQEIFILNKILEDANLLDNYNQIKNFHNYFFVNGSLSNVINKKETNNENYIEIEEVLSKKVYEIASEHLGINNYYLSYNDINSIKEKLVNFLYDKEFHPFEFINFDKFNNLKEENYTCSADVKSNDSYNNNITYNYNNPEYLKFYSNLSRYNLNFLSKGVNIKDWLMNNITNNRHFENNSNSQHNSNNNNENNNYYKHRSIVSSAEYVYATGNNYSIKDLVYKRMSGIKEYISITSSNKKERYKKNSKKSNKDKQNNKSSQSYTKNCEIEDCNSMYDTKIMKLRDNIDYSFQLEKSKNKLISSYTNHPYLFRYSLKMNFYLLYYKLNSINNLIVNYKDKTFDNKSKEYDAKFINFLKYIDPLYLSKSYNIKNINSHIYNKINFEKENIYDINPFKNKIPPLDYITLNNKQGNLKVKEIFLPEVYIEENKELYNEMLNIINQIENKLKNYLIDENENEINEEEDSFKNKLDNNIFESSNINNKRIKYLKNMIKTVKKAVNLCINMVEYQTRVKYNYYNNGHNLSINSNIPNMFKKLIYYDIENKLWKGWFVDLYQNIYDYNYHFSNNPNIYNYSNSETNKRQESLFNDNHFYSKLYSKDGEKTKRFHGYNLFLIQNTSKYGYVLINDFNNNKKQNKILLTVTGSFDEVYKKLNNESLSNNIFSVNPKLK